MTRKKILVIEDEHTLRKDMLDMLGYEGFDGVGAEDGLEGLKMARQEKPDLIICDIMMPGDLKGFDVLAELRKDRMTALIPFIFLTARTDRIDQRHGMELGADDYLTKPFKISELLAAIGTRLKKHEEIAAASQEKMQALRENLITSLPHELRTPLNTIIGFSDMLMVDADTLQPKLVAEWSQLIHAAGMRLYRLIENYLVYARIETLFRDPKQVATMRNNRVQHPAESLEYQVTVKAQQAGRASDLTLDLEDTASVIASEEDLKKILDEIVDNAFKFSESGKAVIVKARVVDNFYQIDVTDHGRGFTPEQIAAVGAYMQFERWIYEQQGLGLGLTIARRFAELYGGTMKIESVHGEKTTATIRLLCG